MKYGGKYYSGGRYYLGPWGSLFDEGMIRKFAEFNKNTKEGRFEDASSRQA